MEENKDHIWFLMARKFSGEASVAEMTELELLLMQNPNENYSMEILADLWQNNAETDSLYSENKYRELLLRMQHMGINTANFADSDGLVRAKKGFKIKIPKTLVFTIVSLMIAGVTVFLLFQKSQSKDISKVQQELLAKHEIKTNYGSKTSMVLPDGSKVWLNAGSKMTYNKDYGVEVREVNLTGEAYFDVVKNEKKPFLIHAGKVNIRVLGTAFNVRSYPDEKNTETSLVRGSLEISMMGSPEKYILKPNEKLIVSNSLKTAEKGNNKNDLSISARPNNEIELTNLSVLPQDNSIVETSWVYNKLVFSSETFEEVALKMERWYAVDIIIKNENLKRKKFTGVFENETVSQALDAIQLTTAFSYSITNEQITISK